MVRNQKRQIRIYLLNLQDKHCKKCTDENRKEDRYCSQSCSIGQQMVKVGQMLLEPNPKKPKEKNKMKMESTEQMKGNYERKAEKAVLQEKKEFTLSNLTKEDYIKLKEQKLSDNNIAKKYNTNTPYLSKWKKENDALGYCLTPGGQLQKPEETNEVEAEIAFEQPGHIEMLQRQLQEALEKNAELERKLAEKEITLPKEELTAMEMVKRILNNEQVRIPSAVDLETVKSALDILGAEYNMQSMSVAVSLRNAG